MQTHRPAPRRAWRNGRWEEGARAVPAECAVALVYNGTTQAVMMATPADLGDFGLGFSLTEGIVTGPSEIREVETLESAGGIELRIWLEEAAESRFMARRRAQVGPVGCGLCGIDSLAEALRPLPSVQGGTILPPADVGRAMAALARAQTLNIATRAVHAAGFWIPGRGLALAREDVGRHNALDKLAGGIVRKGVEPASGAVVLTSRVSVDMVQKCAVMGAPILLAASAPTALAIETAESAGLTLAAVVRGDEFEVFSHPHRITEGAAAHVA